MINIKHKDSDFLRKLMKRIIFIWQNENNSYLSDKKETKTDNFLTRLASNNISLQNLF